MLICNFVSMEAHLGKNSPPHKMILWESYYNYEIMSLLWEFIIIYKIFYIYDMLSQIQY